MKNYFIVLLFLLLNVFCSDLSFNSEDEPSYATLQMVVNGVYWGDTLTVSLENDRLIDHPFITDSSQAVYFEMSRQVVADSSYKIESSLRRSEGKTSSAAKTITIPSDADTIVCRIDFDSLITISD